MNEQLLQQIAERITALGEQVSEQRLKALIQGEFLAQANAPEFQRKMRFTGEGGPLRGSKFEASRLSVADVLFLNDFLDAGRIAGRSQGPSEATRNVVAAHGQRAMDTSESGYGSQLVGAAYNTSLWDAALAQSRVFSLFPSFQMKAATEYLPVAAGLPEVLLLAESTASDSSNYTTSKTGSNRVTVTAKKLGFHEMWSGEMEEDSIIPYLPFLRARAEAAIAYYNDSVVLNGDTTNAGTGNINLDDADPADTKHYLAFDGLRHVGIVDNTGNQKDMAAAITYAALNAMRARMLDRTYMTDWGHPQNPADLVYIADPQIADAIGALDDVLNWKLYNGRPLMNGEIAQILGHAVISAIAMPLTEADGKVSTTAGNNTKGQVVCVNRNGFVVGWMRGVKMEFERIPATDQSRMVYTWRTGFGRYSPTGAASGIEAADVMFDITVPS